MRVSDLQYYIKFVFHSSDGECLSTTDYNVLSNIHHPLDLSNPISSLSIGDHIFIDIDDGTQIEYEITNISIHQITSNTDNLKYGVDLNDCESSTGVVKDFLLKIQVSLKKI